MKLSIIVKLLLFITLTVGVGVEVKAQDDNDNPPVDTPFDGGVSLLVAAAIGYSAKKAHDKRKKKKTEQGDQSVDK